MFRSNTTRIGYAISLSVFIFSASTVRGQTETYDLATYVPPGGWIKNTSNKNVVSYAVTNNQKGTYCQIGIYKSTTSKGSLQADFESEWQELVVKTYKPGSKPQLTPPASENGWDVQAGVAPFEFNGAQSVSMLVTMSGYARCLSIVILTNTEDYQPQIEKFLESVDLKKPATTSQSPAQPSPPVQSPPAPVATSHFAFSTTNFDNGWTSTVQEDWVQVVKGNVKVLIHYPNINADAYNSVLLDGLKNAWNVLVAPKYSAASNFEFKPITGWQSIEFAEADVVEKTTGRAAHVVLFKMNYSNGSGKYMEFITPDKRTFEQEFGPYHETSYGWEKVEIMANYNKFAVGPADLQGTWTNNFSGMIQYVNAYTGADAGANTHASSEIFKFSGNTYHWELSVASGMVGNIKFQNVSSNGKVTVPNNWQIHFSDLEGKPKTYNAYFSCVKGARILWLEDSAYANGYSGYGKKE